MPTLDKWAVDWRARMSRLTSQRKTTSSNQAKPNLACLPVELLENIIQYAGAPTLPRPDDEDHGDMDRETLRQLCLVCRHVSQVATAQLYSHIVVDSGATLGLLLRTMAETSRLRSLVRSLMFTRPLNELTPKQLSFLGQWSRYGQALVTRATALPSCELLDPVMLFRGLDVSMGRGMPWAETHRNTGWGVDTIPAQMLILALVLCAPELRHFGIMLSDGDRGPEYHWLMGRLAVIACKGPESSTAMAPFMLKVEAISILYSRNPRFSYLATPSMQLCSPLLRLPRLTSLRVSSVVLLDSKQDYEGSVPFLRTRLTSLDIAIRDPDELLGIRAISFTNLRSLTFRFTASSYHDLFTTPSSLALVLPSFAASLEHLSLRFNNLFEDLWFARHHHRTSIDGLDQFGRRCRITSLDKLTKLKTLEIPFAGMFGFYPCAYRCTLDTDSTNADSAPFTILPKSLQTLVFQPESLKNFPACRKHYDHRRLHRPWELERGLWTNGNDDLDVECRCLAYQCLMALARRVSRDHQPELRRVLLNHSTPGWRKLLDKENHAGQLRSKFAVSGVEFG